MAALGAQSIASSYEQLLQVDRDGGGNTTTHVSVKDGDNGTTFGFTIASDALMMSSTNRLEFGDTGTYIHQSADGVLDLDGSGTDVIFYSGTAGDNFTWDASEEKLTITGTNGQTALDVADGNLVVADNVDIEGDIDVNGTANLDNTDIDGTFAVDGATISLDATTSLNIDNTNTTNGITVGTATSAVPISIGHTTSVVTVNDELDVTGTVDINDTTDSSSKTTGALKVDGGVGVALKLFVGTDLDVDGTANLDIVDIDGAVDMESTLKILGDVWIGDHTNNNSAGHADFYISADTNEGADSSLLFASGTDNRGSIYYDHNTTAASQKMVFKTGDNAITAMTIDGVGKAGFGVSDPDEPLEVNATANDVGIKLSNSSGTFLGGIRQEGGDNGRLRLADGGSTTVQLEGETGGGSYINSGSLVMTKQPAFLVHPASDQDDIAVGSNVAIVFGTEIFDQGANFASNTFTAPVAGRYQLSMMIEVLELDAASAYFAFNIVTSNRTYNGLMDPDFGQDAGRWTFTLSILADMDASDTASVTLAQNNGTAQTDVTTNSFFSGFLAC